MYSSQNQYNVASLRIQLYTRWLGSVKWLVFFSRQRLEGSAIAALFGLTLLVGAFGSDETS